jgi:hypothetical protein
MTDPAAKPPDHLRKFTEKFFFPPSIPARVFAWVIERTRRVAAEVGAAIGRMSNTELEDQLAQTQAELDRATAARDGLIGEVRARGESIARAEAALRQRRTDYEESNSEQRQINRVRRKTLHLHLRQAI